MSSEDPRALLRRLFRLREPTIGPPPQALEDALLARHAARPSAAPRRRLWSFVGDHRWAFAGVALAIGACRLPVDYQRSFGASVECEAEADAIDPSSINAIGDALRDRIAAESVSVRVMIDDDDRARIRIDVWGDLEDADEAALHVRELAPGMADAECTAAPLAGTVHGTLGGRLGHDLLDLELDRRGASATREAILAQLAAQGFRGSAEVEVKDDGEGRREVMIRLEERVDADDPAAPRGRLVEDEVVEIRAPRGDSE